MAPLWLLIGSALAMTSAAALAQAPDQCRDILPPSQISPAARQLDPEDLVKFRDIGPNDAGSFAAPLFTISPEGRRAAFQLRRADLERNSYCLAMVVVELVPGARPRIVDQGGDLLLLTIDNTAEADFPTGIPQAITPRWSLDGRWIAFLKREGGTTQVWRAAADGSGSAPVTHSPDDVRDFRISADGKSIIYATRPGIARAEQEIAREGLSGWHYDNRWAPVDGNHPFPPPTIPRAVQVLDLASNRVRDATAAEAAMLAEDSQLIATSGAPAREEDPARVWISATSLKGGARAKALHARMPNGAIATCSKPTCDEATNPWVLPDGVQVRFFRREGWADESMAIYQWDLKSGSVRRLYVTDDVLTSCQPSGETLICLRDSSVEPRRLERFDPATGARQLLFDPNPEFAQLTLGKPERLHWRNNFGIEGFGDLVLPVGYEPGKRYPMIVIQYQTRGFLRGGTGDEYPIQAFANRGYAVLSVQRPMPIAIFRGARSFHEGDRMNLAGFADQKSTFSSLETGVRLAIAKGVADPRRLGITGLSNGSTTAVWALLHSNLFSAAAMSSCCWDPGFFMWVGPASAKQYEEVGYPGLLERDAPFWSDVSLAVNARRISTPILLQLADFEYLNALESYTALREAGAPIDMFVYPHEYHNKWQPAHRLADYVRSLDWFDYWLRGIRSEAPERQAELREWDRLRRSIPSGRSH